MAKTIYIETMRCALVPVKFIGYCLTPLELGYNVVVQVKRAHPCYDVGEVLRLTPRSIVEKAGRKDYMQLIKPATLPPRTPENTLPSPLY